MPFNRFLLPALAWFVLITVLLTIPGNNLPSEDWLDKIYFDKWVHIGLFSILSFLLCWWWYKSQRPVASWRRAFIYSIFACIIYGISMEFVQKYLVSNRSFDVYDIVADSVGSALGGWFSIKRYIKK